MKTFYFRKAIRERAGMREFKRSSRAHDPKVAKMRYAAASADYDALIKRLEAPTPAAIEVEPASTITITGV